MNYRNKPKDIKYLLIALIILGFMALTGLGLTTILQTHESNEPELQIDI